MYHMSAQVRTLFLVLGAVAVVAAMMPSLAGASELLMFERRGCIWCARWDREVAPIYGKSDEAQRLPLRRIDLDHTRKPDVTLKEPVIYTPTFVVVDDGREVGRITGYIDDASFWGLLDTFVPKLTSPARATNRSQLPAASGGPT